MADYYVNEDGQFPRACPECRGLGYVVDLIGEVRPCRREECVRKKAVEILEEGHGSDRGAGSNLDDVLGGLLKGNTEFRKLAGSFVMGGLASVVAKMGSELIEKAAKGDALEKMKLYEPEPLPALPASRPTRRRKNKPSRRR